MRHLSVLSILLLTAACAGSPAAPAYLDREAKRFDAPPPGRGAVYLYRKEIMGVAQPIDVGIVGGTTARLGVNEYLLVEGPPGPLEIQCKVGDKTGGTSVTVDSGRTSFVAVSMKIGLWSPGCELGEVAPQQGEAAVRASRRVVSQ